MNRLDCEKILLAVGIMGLTVAAIGFCIGAKLVDIKSLFKPKK